MNICFLSGFTRIFLFYKMLFMNRLEFSCFAVSVRFLKPENSASRKDCKCHWALATKCPKFCFLNHLKLWTLVQFLPTHYLFLVLLWIHYSPHFDDSLDGLDCTGSSHACTPLTISVPDLWHFDMDPDAVPDPRNRTSDLRILMQIWMRICIKIFSDF